MKRKGQKKKKRKSSKKKSQNNKKSSWLQSNNTDFTVKSDQQKSDNWIKKAWIWVYTNFYDMLVHIQKKVILLSDLIVNLLHKLMEWCKGNYLYYTYALAWLLFLMFFTHSGLIYEYFLVNGDITNKFYRSQASLLGMFVNISLIAMIMTDFWFTTHHTPRKSSIFVFISLMLCLGIMFHCSECSKGNLSNYIFPISSPSFSLWLYGILLIIVYSLRVISIKPSVIESSKEL